LIQEVTGDLPQNNVQGIVSVGQPTGGDATAGTLDGGEVSTQSGATSVTVCSGDNVSNILQLANNASNADGVQYAYIFVYDDNTIGGLVPTGLIQLEGSPTLNASIYGFAYTGNITFSAGEDFSTATLADGEVMVSSNAVDLTIQNGGCSSAIDRGFDSSSAQSRNAQDLDGLVYLTAQGIVAAKALKASVHGEWLILIECKRSRTTCYQ